MRDAPPPKLAKHSVATPINAATIGRTHFYRVEDVERFVKTGSWFKAD